MTGLLLLNKPLDMRSTQCVELVRNKLGRKTKVGHGGTLDSTASGLLIILIGAATRLSNFVMDMPKCYETTACLGVETSTDDASGEVTGRHEWRQIKEKDINLLKKIKRLDTGLCQVILIIAKCQKKVIQVYLQILYLRNVKIMSHL